MSCRAKCFSPSICATPTKAFLTRWKQAYREVVTGIAKEGRVEIEEKRIWNSPAVKFAPALIQAVREGVKQAGFSSRDMASGAGHDAAYIARVAPTTMIFVPCLGGISHNEEESTTLEECAAGAQVSAQCRIGP